MRRILCTAIVLALSGTVSTSVMATAPAAAAKPAPAQSALPTTQLPRDVRPTRNACSRSPRTKLRTSSLAIW